MMLSADEGFGVNEGVVEKLIFRDTERAEFDFLKVVMIVSFLSFLTVNQCVITSVCTVSSSFIM